MVHLRIVAPSDTAEKALELLCAADSVVNVIHLKGAARKPRGDVILCDVAREDASVIIGDLKELEIPREGSIAVEMIDSEISDLFDHAEKAAKGLPTDAVVWEEVESRTSESTELSVSFVLFMVLAMVIAAVGIMEDSEILIIGAMIVGPEFGPIAGFCVAVVQLRKDLAKRSLAALAVGFPAGIVFTWLFTLALKWIEVAPDSLDEGGRQFTAFISNPNDFSFIVAFAAGIVGILSLTSAKSGALVGVLVSITTIPAAANVGVAAAYSDWSEVGGAFAQLCVNLSAISAAGVMTLFIQRRVYIARRRRHLRDPAREAAGLPHGRSRRTRITLKSPN